MRRRIRRVRKGACGRRPAATLAPRPQAYLTDLRDALAEAREYVSHLKPTWLQTISESCAPDEDWAAPRFPDSGIGAISCCTLPVQVLVVNFLRSPVAER